MSTAGIPSRFPSFTIITADTPEAALVSFVRYSCAEYLWIRRPVDVESSGYVVEEVSMQRRCMRVVNEDVEPDIYAEDIEFAGGIPWPHDLMDVPGLWKYPLPTTFDFLTVLDLAIGDAAFWIIPIVRATPPTAPLRRILLRFCVDWKTTAIPFPFRELNETLGPRSDVKLLLAWAHVDERENGFINVFKSRLRKLNKDRRIGVLYESGPKCKSQYLPPSLLQ